MTTLPVRQQDIRHWLPGIAAFVLVALVLLIVLSGTSGIEMRTGSNSGAGPISSPATISNPVPAHIQEGIVFGEIEPTDVTSSADIMPVHVVEQSYFEQ